MKKEFENYYELFDQLVKNANVIGIEGNKSESIVNSMINYFKDVSDKEILRIPGDNTDGVVMAVSAIGRWLDYENQGFGMFDTVLFIGNAEKLHDMSVLTLKNVLSRMDNDNYVIVLSGVEDSDWGGVKKLVGENLLTARKKK